MSTRKSSQPVVMRRFVAGAIALAAAICPPAFGLITGAEGNKPIDDPGFPKGAIDLFNQPTRIAYWEGPPFGGGQYHGEYEGDARQFNAVLADFAKLDVKSKQLVVHDGIGHSFWLNMNNDPAKEEESRMDWGFVVWSTDSWNRLRDLPPDLNPVPGRKPGDEAPIQLDVYTGGRIKWAEVTVPKGVEVTDERLVAHGFKLTDACVLEGKVTALDTKRPLPARVILQRVATQSKGGYNYTPVQKTSADAQGHWTLKKIPAGWYRVVIEADGHVSRVAGFCRPTDQPRWYGYDCALARPAAVTGQVTDQAGQPLAEVEVRLGDVLAKDDISRYQSAQDYKTKTDAQGRFKFAEVPIGTAEVWVTKPGYVHPGLGPKITVPADQVALTMRSSGTVRVTVDFEDSKRPAEYIVEIEAEGGPVVGSWGGSAQIDADNRYTFKDLPPGRYVVTGRPNPGRDRDQTDPITIEVKPGETKELTIKAR